MKSKLLIALFSIFIIVFNVCFFVITNDVEINSSVWVSYAFIHLAYLVFVASFFCIRKSPGSNAYFAPTVYITWKYFALEFVVGIFFMLSNFESMGLPLVVQLVIAGVFIIYWLIHLTANEYTAESLKVQETEIAYIKESSYKIKSMLQDVSDTEIQRNLQRCYEALVSSPSRSCPAVRSIEQEIMNTINDIEDAVFDKNTQQVSDAVKKVMRLVSDRNIKIKLNR